MPGLTALTITSTISFNGNLLGNTQNASLFDPQGTVLLNGAGSSGAPESFEAMSQDLGAVPAGFVSEVRQIIVGRPPDNPAY